MSEAEIVAERLERTHRVGGGALLVAVTGIDHAGKSWWTQRIAQALRARERNVACVRSNDWYRPQGDGPLTASAFYHDGMRLDELFSQVLFPLRARRGLDVEVGLTARGSRCSHRYRYQFSDIDVVLVDGPFLLKRGYQRFFDVGVWVDATAETALERGLARKELRHDAAAIERIYREVYLPAQDMHLSIDDPQSATMLTIRNDDRLPVALKRVLSGSASR